MSVFSAKNSDRRDHWGRAQHPESPAFHALGSSRIPYQINKRENSDPDNIKHMPEQIKAEQSPENIVAKAFYKKLRHHCA